MNNSIFTVLISSFLFSHAVSTSAETLVGELPGEFVVNNLGAASYTVPLSILPGTAGVEPELSVSYSSRGGNGFLGLGCSLDGISTITRNGTSIAQDGFIDGVDFDSNDRFLLDSKRLEVVAGTYGAADSEYRTEIDSFSRVVAQGQAGSGPSWFKVWTKPGLIYEYGNTVDSSYKPGSYSSVMEWHVNKVSDTAGNTMTFTYTQTSSGPRISRIDYTGNSGQGLLPYNSVEFVYEDRPDDKLRFFKGVEMESTKRLAKIIMKHEGTLVHEYRFGYVITEAGQSVLQSFQQFFENGDSLPQTRFEFGGVSVGDGFAYTSGAAFFPSGLSFFSDILYRDAPLTGDFNGDGLTDIGVIGSMESSRWLGLSNGDGTFSFSDGYDVLSSDLDFNGNSGHGNSILLGDFNGDGMSDVCGLGDAASERWSGLSNGDGSFTFTKGYSFFPQSLTHLGDSGNGDHAFTGDFNGDGLTDICGFGVWEDQRWLGLSDGDGSFTFKKGYNVLPSRLDFYGDSYNGNRVLTGDFNGDGRTDIFGVGPTEDSCWSGLSDGDGTFTFTEGYNALPSDLTFYGDSWDGGRVLSGDFNGDGLADLCAIGSSSEERWVGLSDGDGTFTFTKGYAAFPSRLSFVGDIYSDDLVLSGDFNGDGLADICSISSEEDRRWIGLSKGDGTFSFTEGYNFLPSAHTINAWWDSYGQVLARSDCFASDFNGDGLTDICGMGWDSEACWIGLSNGDGSFDFSTGSEFLPSALSVDGLYSYSGEMTAFYPRFSGDFNGDGMEDFARIGSGASGNWVALNTNEVSRLDTVTQGFLSASEHGVVTEIEYLPITDPDVYIKGSGAEFPIKDMISPMTVVSRLSKDNGQGGTYATDYTYQSARYHLHGRGFLGFHQFISYDNETDICYAETLAQEFPFTGRPLKTETLYIDPTAAPSSPGYCQTNKVVYNDWQYDLVDGGTKFAYTTKSVETKWELGDSSAPVSVVTAYNWFDNQNTNALPPIDQPDNLYSEITHGNLVKSVIDYGDGLKKTTVNSYDDRVTSTNWFLGRIDTSSVTHEAPGQSNVVRSSSFDYYEETGLLSQEVIEPGDPQFELITDYYYDGFGNITNKALTPAGLPARTVLANDYDAKGRFVEESRNALGHPTTFVNDPILGKPLSSTDPNNLTTHWRYDPTGRLIYEKRPDNTVTTNSYVWDFNTVVNVPAGPGTASTVAQTSVYTLHTETDGAPPVTTWFDKQGREIRVQTKSADGRNVLKDTGYNAVALPIAVSEPYFTAETPVWTFTEYDDLGRPQFVTSPDGTVTETVYNGLSLSVIQDSNHRTTGEGVPKHQVTTSVKNAKGDLLSVTDAMSNTVHYVHDAVGNLIQTTDPENNVIEMRYDIRGNKTRQDDPDMGEWNYTYNALNQLVFQQDANSNQVVTAYDLLGRITARTNFLMTATGLVVEAVAEWDYDGTGEGEKLGMLRLEEHRDGQDGLINRKRYAYDEYSRPMLELMNYDQKWYYTCLRYNAYSRVEYTDRYWRPMGKEGIEHNLDPEWNRFTVRNHYNAVGALLSITDGSSNLWWEADASDYDQQNRLTQYVYGNGLITTNEYNLLTGRLEGKEIRTAQDGLSAYQFGYDRIGNLTQRTQSRPSMTALSETGQYDALNRLRTNSVSGVTNRTATAAYDALGNIQSRTGIGTYLYNSSRPHAVTSAGDCEYFYDSNGNIVRRERSSVEDFSAEWTSFNKPSRIVSETNRSEFAYSVDGRRTQQLIFDGSNVVKKVYATPAYEMREVLLNPEEPDRDLWDWEMDFCRIYVDTPAGKVGIYQQEGSTNGVGAVTRSYIHKDHLGSVIAVSDESASLEFYSYDAWGNRRNADDWSPSENPELLTDSRTDRGYTGHEMLDNLNLVHMNGRIYDPVLGRFISPDPLIQSPDSLQSFNRYSYVWNNPLSLSDPSGFAAAGHQAASVPAAEGSYAEPIAANPISEIGFVRAQSRIADATEYLEIYDEEGVLLESTEVVRGSSGGGEAELLSSRGSISGFDIRNYGLNTGGFAQLPEEYRTFTGLSANNMEFGMGDLLASPFLPPPGVSLDSGPPSVTDTAVGKVVVGAGTVAMGFVPYLADAMDIYDVGAPNSSAFGRSVGGTSLAVNAWTFGIAPNAGPIRRGLGMIGDAFRGVFKRGGDVAQTALRNSDELTTTLYHGGNLRDGVVQPSRISLTPDVKHAQRYAKLNGGKVYQFDVPSSRLRQMEIEDNVLRFQDSYFDTGNFANEFRFKPAVAPELNLYR